MHLALKVQQDSTLNLFYGSPVSSVTVTQPSCFPEVVILDWYDLISCPDPTHSKGNGFAPLSTFLVGLHLILAQCCATHGLFKIELLTQHTLESAKLSVEPFPQGRVVSGHKSGTILDFFSAPLGPLPSGHPRRILTLDDVFNSSFQQKSYNGTWTPGE